MDDLKDKPVYFFTDISDIKSGTHHYRHDLSNPSIYIIDNEYSLSKTLFAYLLEEGTIEL